jgi:polyhydroxyalkanoate synthase
MSDQRKGAGETPAGGDPINPPRLGPRPLGMHLALASSTWMGGAVAMPSALTKTFPWHQSLGERAARLVARITPEIQPLLQQALIDESGRRIQNTLAGIEAYRRHPYHRHLKTPAAIATFGTSRLIDYGLTTPKKSAKGQKRPIILCVPSLINPSYILDLNEDLSLMRYLGRAGFRPLLVDWGLPGEVERKFTLSDYITQRLKPMLEKASGLEGGPVNLLGYCMGGNLALALAQLNPGLVSKLALLATPWDFHVTSVTQARALSTMMSGIVAAFEKSGEVPVDFLQLFFTSIDPTLSDRKFRRFAKIDPASPAAQLFVAIEDWSNDGAPLAAGVARECLHEWYSENTPAKGRWRIAGEIIDPAKIKIPSLVILPSNDRIVPPASARALAEALPNAKIIEAPAGHVTMIVGPAAKSTLWEPLANWFRGMA